MKKKKSVKKCCKKKCCKSLKKRDKDCIKEKDKKKSCAPCKYCQKAGGSKEELEKMLKSMTKEELISIILISDIDPVATVRPIESFTAESIHVGPEPEPEPYQMPEKIDGSAFGFFDKNIYDKLYKDYIDESEYPSKETCSQVKKMCDLDPLYCKENKLKEKYHKLCIEIKSTLDMIQILLNPDNQLKRMNSGDTISSAGSKDIYEIDEYIDSFNDHAKYSGKMKFDSDVIDCFKEHINDMFGDLRQNRIYSTGGEDLLWYDLETELMNGFNENNLEKFMYIFGIKLHSKNPQRYYPLIVEKIKQKILQEYFM